MFESIDKSIDPAQAWDFYQLFPNSDRIHNCPIWNRLSGWTSEDCASIIVTGSDADERCTNLLIDSLYITARQYAKIMHKNEDILYALIRTYGIKPKIEYARLFEISELKELCENYYPVGYIRKGAAIEIVKNGKFLPSPVFTIEKFEFYDAKDCEAARERVLESYRNKKELIKKQNAERSLEVQRRRAEDNEKRRILREEKQKALMAKEAERVLKLPDNCITLSQVSKNYGIPKSTLFRAYHVGILTGRLYRDNVILDIGEIEKYIASRNSLKEQNKRRQRIVKNRPERNIEVPDGYLTVRQALKVFGAKNNALYKALEGKKFDSIRRGKYWFIEKKSFHEYLDVLKKMRADRQLRLDLLEVNNGS